MLFKKANLEDFHRIKQFYWDLIDEMSDQNDKIGWKKGIYPTDSFLQESLDRGELFVLEEGGGLCASVILNSACNEGYAGVTWSIECGENEILVPHDTFHIFLKKQLYSVAAFQNNIEFLILGSSYFV